MEYYACFWSQLDVSCHKVMFPVVKQLNRSSKLFPLVQKVNYKNESSLSLITGSLIIAVGKV